MKKLKLLFYTSALMFAGISFANAQQVVLSHKVHSTQFTNDGAVYEILGEITNNSGKNVCGVSVNVNYYDESGKKLSGSNYLVGKSKDEYSDSQSSSVDYLAKGVTVPFRFIRFVDKISGKVAKSEVTVTARVIKTPTCAIIENVKTERVDEGYGTAYYNVTGDFKCTAGKVYNGYVFVAGYDDKGVLLNVFDYVLDDVKGLDAGKSVSFKVKFRENEMKFAQIKVSPSYRGDWDEK